MGAIGRGSQFSNYFDTVTFVECRPDTQNNMNILKAILLWFIASIFHQYSPLANLSSS